MGLPLRLAHLQLTIKHTLLNIHHTQRCPPEVVGRDEWPLTSGGGGGRVMNLKQLMMMMIVPLVSTV